MQFKKYFLFTILCMPVFALTLMFSARQAHASWDGLLSGDWFVYGTAIYQPNDIVVLEDSKAQHKYESKFFYGIGAGKDHLRLEFSKFAEKPRFILAFDVFPKALATPYVAYVHSRQTKPTDQSGVQRVWQTVDGILVGVTIRPIKWVEGFAEMNLTDKYFFAGIRLKLIYTVK